MIKTAVTSCADETVEKDVQTEDIDAQETNDHSKGELLKKKAGGVRKAAKD